MSAAPTKTKAFTMVVSRSEAVEKLTFLGRDDNVFRGLFQPGGETLARRFFSE